MAGGLAGDSTSAGADTTNKPNAQVRDFRRGIATTAMANFVQLAATGVTGILIARTLGPHTRGEYAAIMAWFGAARTIGELGQATATTYFVASDRTNARTYVASSRKIVLLFGLVVASLGLIATPLLASGREQMAYGYVLMFATCLAYFGGVSLVFSLQAVATTDWNAVRIFQPVAFAVIVWALYAFGVLTLIACLSAISVTILAQTVLAYVLAGRNDLLGGSADHASTKAMSRYGLHQLAGAAPGVLITQLDQLALSVTVKPQALGHYAAAISLTSLALPAASALGSVVFPRIALQYKRDQAGTDRLQRQVLVVTIVLSFAVMAALMLSARWTVPLVFGEEYRAATPLVWILAPGMALFAFSQICADILRGYGQPLIIAKVQWVAAGASMVAMAVLLPTFGATGAALATLGSSAVAAAGIGWAMRRRSLAQRTQAASDGWENE